MTRQPIFASPRCKNCGQAVALHLLRQIEKGDSTVMVGPECDPNENKGPLMTKSPAVGSNYSQHMAAKRSRMKKREGKPKRR